MNWFTKSNVDWLSADAKTALVKTLDGECEHVMSDNSSLFVVSKENDSFGYESYGMCKACHTAAEAEEKEQEDTCSDCKGTFKLKHLSEWKWYDFYAAQGDTPFLLCSNCKVAEKHINRKRKDEADREDELG